MSKTFFKRYLFLIIIVVILLAVAGTVIFFSQSTRQKNKVKKETQPFKVRIAEIIFSAQRTPRNTDKKIKRTAWLK